LDEAAKLARALRDTDSMQPEKLGEMRDFCVALSRALMARERTRVTYLRGPRARKR
jgi:hypothetical protein